MKNLAVCIPTYNHAELVDELLVRSGAIFKKAEWDIYIFDSSENDETELVVKRFCDSGLDIYYEKIDSNIGSNTKVINIYKLFQTRNEYEYVWICPDYINLLKPGIEKISSYLERKYDFIVINYRDCGRLGFKEYKNCNELFKDCAWHMTSYMATIVKVNEAFKNIRWQEFEEKYMDEICIYHSHVALYFESMPKINNFLACHIPLKDTDMAASMLRKGNYWRKDTFHVWAKCWPAVIKKLPKEYTKREKVIKDLGVLTGIFSKENFIQLRKEGIYTPEIYEEYRNDWSKLTNVKDSNLKKIAFMTSEQITKQIKEPRQIIRTKKRLKKFCDKYNEIYLYGCGAVGNAYANYMDEMGLRYEGFIVSSTSCEKKEFHNHRVFQMSKEFIGNNIGIVLALNKNNQREVLKSIITKGNRCNLLRHK